MKLIRRCLLALALLGSLADAQYGKPQQSQTPLQQTRPLPPRPLPPRPVPPQRTLPQEAYVPQKAQPPQAPMIPRYAPPQRQEPAIQMHQGQQNRKTDAVQIPEVFQSCDVSERYKIKCGPSIMTGQECEAINCCFDGRSCYYGKMGKYFCIPQKNLIDTQFFTFGELRHIQRVERDHCSLLSNLLFSVTLQATKDATIILVVARDATIPNLDLESITFLGDGPTCSPIDTSSAFAIYQFSVTACGTIMTVSSATLLTLQFDLNWVLSGVNQNCNTAYLL